MPKAAATAEPEVQTPRPFVPGSLLRALGALVNPEATHDACRVVHVSPGTFDGAAGEPSPATVVEAVEGRVFVRATLALGGPVDEGMIVDQRTALRFSGDEFVEFDGRRVVKPFELDVETDGARDGHDAYPCLDELVPKPDQRLLFCVSAKELKRVAAAMTACGVGEVEVLAPEYRGGPLGFRGSGAGALVEACIMPRHPFAAPAQAADDVPGQSLFDFRDVGDELREREARAAGAKFRGAIQELVDGGDGVDRVEISAGGKKPVVVAELRRAAKPKPRRK